MEKLQPKLRFPEFKENWKIEALEEYIDLFSGIALKSEEISDDNNGTPILRGINITEGSIRHTKEIDRYYLGNVDKLHKYFVKEDDLVLGMDGSKVGKNVALIKKEDENAILIQRVARIRSNSKSNIRYIYQQVFSKKFHDYVDIVNTSSGIPHISSQQIKDFKIGFPSLPEQTKIANFLSAVDEKINLLKEKKSLLEDYKKGIMQKIFSQEIRFKDDKGNDFEDWIDTKLGDFAKITTGSSNREDSNLDGEYTFFDRSQDIRSSNRFLFDAEAIIVPGEGQEFVPKYFKGKFDLHQRTYAIMDFGDNNGIFLFYSITFNKNHLNSHAVGSTVKSLRLPMFTSMPIKIPNIQEQTKIANFLSSIDEKIELVNKKIQDTQDYKKGLLQQMFV